MNLFRQNLKEMYSKNMDQDQSAMSIGELIDSALSETNKEFGETDDICTMKNMNNKEKFCHLLRSTGREGVETIISELEDSGFFEAPASANHHLNCIGGLLQHSLNVCETALAIRSALEEKGQMYVHGVPRDSVIIDSLLHDVCKSDIYKEALVNKKSADGKWEKGPGYIVDCDEGAEIIFGFKKDIDKETFRKSIEENTLLDYVNRVKVKKGDIFFIEAGTLHAICKGILLAEVQQNSNTTYRVYDYGRLQNGKPRELHIDKAIDVTSTKAIPACGKPQGEPEKKDGYTETLLTSCELFTVKRLDVEEKAALTAGKESFVSLVALEGNGVVMHGDSCVTLYKGDSLFIPAGFGDFEILGEVTVLETRI